MINVCISGLLQMIIKPRKFLKNAAVWCGLWGGSTASSPENLGILFPAMLHLVHFINIRSNQYLWPSAIGGMTPSPYPSG